MRNNYDVIIIGAGSVGVPAAMSLAKNKVKVLVIDSLSSVGQGQNKSAIGGIRATHSDEAKIKTALKSIDIFSNWQKNHGTDINWQKGGYLFPIYKQEDKTTLTNILQIQKSYGLNINWIEADEVKDIVNGINADNLLGATYSPDDGSASPLLSINAFYAKALEYGAKFNFKETVTAIKISSGKVEGVKTNKADYNAKFVINCAGGYAKEVAGLAGVDLPVVPDMHEGGITEPVERIFNPMLVDIRQSEGAKNYYFYQAPEGQIVFCMTPNPALLGTNTDCTSSFLPSVAKKMITLLPKLAGIKVRRTWRGLYPMTPDGFPIVDKFDNVDGFISAAGMCGQGFMLGPGLGELITKLVLNTLPPDEKNILKGFTAKRSFAGTEVYK